MPVTKTELVGLEAKRPGTPGKGMNIRIDVNSSIAQIYLIEQDTARVDFRWTATYTGIGTLNIEGRITYTGEAKELYESWTNTNQMPDAAAQEIHSVIMKTCMPVAVLLSREVNLPPPLPMPPINVKGNKKKATPASNIEVA